MKQGTLDSFVHVEKKTKMNDLNQETDSFFSRFSNDFEMLFYVVDYYSRLVDRPPLLAPLLSLRYLLLRGIEIHGHEDDILGTSNKGNFVELLVMLSKYDENIDQDMLNEAPLIQNDMINACSQETTKVIVKDVGGDNFSILVDHYQDGSYNEYIALCLRYVNKEGDVVERFLGVERVMDFTALSRRDAIYSLLEKHSLSLSSIRGQSYTGNSNISGDISELKTLIKKETQSAYCIHCFAHDFELTLVSISKHHTDCWCFFKTLTKLLDLFGVCWKEKEFSKETRFQEVAQVFDNVEIEKGGYYKLISNVDGFYTVILDMLDIILEDSTNADDRYNARSACFEMWSFDFVFIAHLMKTLFGVTDELNVVLQKKEQDIAIAMELVKLVKKRLQIIRNEGWETLLSSVISFCEKDEIKVPNMEDLYKDLVTGKISTTNLHHYQVEVFFTIVDLQLQELDNRFDEESMELLVCTGSLNPVDSFRCFDKKKLLRLAEFYPYDFSSVDLFNLADQLDKYIHDMRKDGRFLGLNDLKQLSRKLVELKKHEAFNLVYLLIKMVLILPVSTPRVERAFSVMTYVESQLRQNIGDQQLNDRLVTYIERDVFSKISNEDILNNFQSKKTRVLL